MSISEVSNLVALIVIPIAAVLIGQHLQNRAEKRKDKMRIFKTLMTARIYGWTVDSVHALNVIDVVFADDKQVRAAWKDLNDKYHVSNPDQQHLIKIQFAQYKLLETIANSLGYKNKITWETIQNPYIPDALFMQLEAQKESQQAYSEIITGMRKMMPTDKSEDGEQKNGGN